MNMIKFAKLISYITSLLASNSERLSEQNIEFIEQNVNELFVPNKCNLYPMFDAIVAGKKFEAVKAYRELTGEGLVESKNAIERLIKGQPNV